MFNNNNYCIIIRIPLLVIEKYLKNITICKSEILSYFICMYFVLPFDLTTLDELLTPLFCFNSTVLFPIRKHFNFK